MKWINSNKVQGEMSDSEFAKKIEEEAKTRDIKKYGRDGNFEVYSESFSYKNVPYHIKILRYYQIGVPLNKIEGMNKLGKWAVLESPPELKQFALFLGDIEQITGVYEWLWRDTLHAGQEDWTLKQMVEQMHKEAKDCIDILPTIKTRVEQRLQTVLETLDKLLPKFKKKEEK